MSVTNGPTKSDGGPSGYYDFLPGWVTLNDAMEWLAQRRWGPHSLHLKDAMKACMRFGSKDGVEPAYDAKKLVYSGLRLLMMAKGRNAVHEYLEALLADPQFRPEEEQEDLQALFEADIASTDIGFTNDSPEAHPEIARATAEWVAKVARTPARTSSFSPDDDEFRELVLGYMRAGDLSLRLSFVASVLNWFGVRDAIELSAPARVVFLSAMNNYDEKGDPLGAAFFSNNGKRLEDELFDELGRTRIA